MFPVSLDLPMLAVLSFHMEDRFSIRQADMKRHIAVRILR